MYQILIIRLDLGQIDQLKKKKKNCWKKFFFLEIFFGPPGIVWNFNPGWSRDHPGLYGFSMYGDPKKIFFDFFFIIFLIHSGQNDPDYVKFLQAWFAWLNH